MSFDALAPHCHLIAAHIQRIPLAPGNRHSAAGTWRNKRTGDVMTVWAVGYIKCEAWVWFRDLSGVSQEELYSEWERVRYTPKRISNQ